MRCAGAPPRSGGPTTAWRPSASGSGKARRRASRGGATGAILNCPDPGPSPGLQAEMGGDALDLNLKDEDQMGWKRAEGSRRLSGGYSLVRNLVDGILAVFGDLVLHR